MLRLAWKTESTRTYRTFEFKEILDLIETEEPLYIGLHRSYGNGDFMGYVLTVSSEPIRRYTNGADGFYGGIDKDNRLLEIENKDLKEKLSRQAAVIKKLEAEQNYRVRLLSEKLVENERLKAEIDGGREKSNEKRNAKGMQNPVSKQVQFFWATYCRSKKTPEDKKTAFNFYCALIDHLNKAEQNSLCPWSERRRRRESEPTDDRQRHEKNRMEISG